MQFKKIAFLSILLTLFITGCSDSKVEEEGKTTAEKIQRKTEFNLQKLDGTTITIKKQEENLIFMGLENKVILLNFFTTWCPPCKAEIPHLNNLKDKYPNDIEIIAVSLAQEDGNLPTNDILQTFKEEFNIKYQLVNSAENYELAKEMGGIRTIPTMFLFNPKGELKQKYIGIVPEEMLETDINKELGKK
ncbi:thioredoxin [Malaciobacter mytili]|uniref:TlpA family protein disulfide reductase n=1 Tax=Malaciobacter mytili TaxID=603050 RepID=UPI00100BD31C|nr:TlpA disulfide reductase family protein [Malaciobacter mytili]RXI45784.1 thioredoxin [Malaciobacter mytili]